MLFFTFCKTEGTTDVRAVNGEMLTYNLQTVRSKAYGPTLARFYAFSWITFWASFQVQKGGGASKLLEWVSLMALGAGLLALLIVRIVRIRILLAEEVDRAVILTAGGSVCMHGQTSEGQISAATFVISLLDLLQRSKLNNLT